MKSLNLEKKDLAACQETIEKSIRNFVSESGASGAVIGLSGGVDSSLVFRLACGSGIKVHAMIMPEGSMSPGGDVRDAISLADEANADYSLIDIGRAVDVFDSSFPWITWDKSRHRPALGNVKARVRMVYNYLAANCGDMIVLGTGNRTEILLGYATKYGDGGVDLQPIGSLYKSQVRQLAAYVGVPRKIIDKVPTAGLWAGQTDEGELGASYADMDRVLFSLVEEKKGVRQTACELGLDESLVGGLNGRMLKNAHKRCVPPVPGLFD